MKGIINMHEHDKLKFKQDKQIFEGLNKVLNACKEKPMNAYAVSVVTGIAAKTAVNYLAKLAKGDNPYVVGEYILGEMNRKSWHFKALRDEFSIDDYETVNDKRIKSAIENGTYVNMICKAKILEAEQTPSHIRTIEMRHVRCPRKAEWRGIGSHMAMW